MRLLAWFVKCIIHILSPSKSTAYAKKRLRPICPAGKLKAKSEVSMQTHLSTFALTRRTRIPPSRKPPRRAGIIHLPNPRKHVDFPRAGTIFIRGIETPSRRSFFPRQKVHRLPAFHPKLQTIPHRMAQDKQSSRALSFRKALAMAHINFLKAYLEFAVR